jgi:hypothetical protein
VICAHKDCERTDTTPFVFTSRSREGEFLGKRTFYFCREHGDQLYALKKTRTLPPADWFE